MSNNLYRASEQWARRPSDERFASLQEMHAVCTAYKDISEDKFIKSENLQPYADKGEIRIDIKDVGPSRFSHWGFQQFCGKVGAPDPYLRNLPATLAANCLSYGLDRMHSDTVQLLVHHNQLDNQPDPLFRSIMTPSYKRIHNADITSRLLGLDSYGWRVPPARPAFPGQDGTRIATLDDVYDMEKWALSVKVGDEIAPAGLYASDHDLFVFMIDPTKTFEDGSGTPLYRGFFLWNSEVGASVFAVQTFMFRHVCSNHIVWGAKNAKIVKIKHIGQAEFLFQSEFEHKLIEYFNSPATLEQGIIDAARKKILGKDKEEVVEFVTSKKAMKIGKRLLQNAYDEVESYPEDGDPTSVWGLMQGLTRLSQITNFADKRVELDTAAGQLLQLAA